MSDTSGNPGKAGVLLVQPWSAPTDVGLDESRQALVFGGQSHGSPVLQPGPWSGNPSRMVGTDRKMFDAFLALGDGKPDNRGHDWAHRALAFAQQWGVIGVCEHGLPASHRSRHRVMQTFWARGDGRWLEPGRHQRLLEGDHRIVELLDDSDRHMDLAACSALDGEPLSLWLMLAEQARAIASAGAILRRGDPCDDEIAKVRSLSPAVAWWLPELKAPLMAGGQRWVFPGGNEVITTPLTRREALAGQRGFLAGVVEEWLNLADVSLTVAWDEDRPLHLGYNAQGLFGAIAVDLALMLSGMKGVWLCSNCGGPYSNRKRAPKTGCLHYCYLCKEAGRQATYRAKRAANDGKPLRSIPAT